MTSSDDDFNQLVDPELDDMHMVKSTANGTQWLVAKSAAEEEGAGLFEPEFVRELVAKADAESAAPPAPEAVTLSGSPLAVADLMHRMHGARVRKAEATPDPELDQVVKATDGGYVAFVKAKYTAEQKEKLAAKGHAMRDEDGKPDYPIDDEEDLGKAVDAVGRGGADHDKIRRYVSRRAKAMGKSDQIPDNWAADGSLKASVSKAAGDTADPGSPSWESQDAASAKQVIAQVTACIDAVKALAQREGAEVGNGHTDDFCDVLDLQGAVDNLTWAAKTLAGFALSEQLEAGETVAKAQPPAAPIAATEAASPKENPVDQTTTEVAKAEATAAAGTEQAQPVSKAAALAELLGISMDKLAELGAQSVIKAASGEPAATQTTGASGAPADTARVIPGTDTVQAPATAATDEVSKAAATDIASAVAAVLAPVVKQLGELATQVNAQGERVEKMGLTPDTRRSPALNGATGLNASPAVRDHSASPINSPEMQAVLKAVDELPKGPVRDEARKRVTKAAIEARLGLV